MRNQENIGADLNFLQCFDNSSGKYVLLLGDDDFLLDGAICAVLKLLSQSNFGVVYLNADKFSDKRLEQIDVEIHESIESLLAKVSYGISFISSCIINKSCYKSLNLSSYRDTHLIHVPFVVEAMKSSMQNAFVKTPLISCGINTVVNYPLFKVFGENFIDLLSRLDKSQVLIIKNNILLDLYPTWITLIRNKKMICNYKEQIMTQIRNDFGNNLIVLLFLFPILRFPYPTNILFRKAQIFTKRFYRWLLVNKYSSYHIVKIHFNSNNAYVE